MGMIGTEERTIRTRDFARDKESLGSGPSLTYWHDCNTRGQGGSAVGRDLAPFPEATLMYGVQWQAGIGKVQYLRMMNGVPCTTTHGYLIPYDFTCMWLATKVIPATPQFGFDLSVYNNGNLMGTYTIQYTSGYTSTGECQYDPCDKGNLSLFIHNVTGSISAFTNPIITAGVRRRS